MKNPLVIFAIIGIVVGYLVGSMQGGVDQNSYLTYGLIGGLLVGYLLDSRNRSNSTRRPTDTRAPGQSVTDLLDQFRKPQQNNSNTQSTPLDIPEPPVQDVAGDGRSKVSRVDESADDVIARAREEIDRNTK